MKLTSVVLTLTDWLAARIVVLAVLSFASIPAWRPGRRGHPSAWGATGWWGPQLVLPRRVR
ncbi:MAG: hypothetical protein ACRCYU_14580 [Nocardioides sp.]